MRLHVDLGSHFVTPPTDRIVQVDNDPPFGSFSNVTGDYLIPSVDGTAISVSLNSFVSPIDGLDVNSEIFGQLLARFPQYSHVYFNPMLTSTDVAAMDLTASLTALFDPDPLGGPNPAVYSLPTRVKIGRSGAIPSGMMPNGLALPPLNQRVLPNRPGLVITQNIDLTAATGGVGADDFMVYWKVYGPAVSFDIAGGNIGSTAGDNEPSFRYLGEINQEAPSFKCFISVDDGQNWVQVQRLTQVAFCGKTNQVRLAFTNESPTTTFQISSFALLF